MSHLPVPQPTDLIAGLIPDPLDPLLTRPLALHHGRAYAAVWPRLRRSLADSDPDLDLPPAPAPYTLLIVRDDGLLSRPVAPADALVRLASLPPLPADRLWSTTGLQAYCAGRRPPPAQVFATLTALFDRFIDFTGSLASQSLMTELLAAYVLATWFLPAFTSFSHLWLLGDTGAGKTRLLHLLTRLAHLGAVVPPYAPTAPLRDLAALGASLAVDNADGLYTSLIRGLAFRPAAATVRQGLFLGGARRDVLFPLHQRLTAALGAPPHPPSAVALTHLDVFGPRLFAAQQPPHPAVAARALFIQLLRSTDRARCLADPSDPVAWPVSPRALTDDLWALSLAHLPELPAHIAHTAAGSALVGAYFQTWHPLLAVASWLTSHGVPGLLDRLRALAQDYPRRTLALGPQAADTTSLAIHAIYGFVALQVEKIIATFAGTARFVNPTLPAKNSSRKKRDSRDRRDSESNIPPQRDSRDTRDSESNTLAPQRDSRNTRDSESNTPPTATLALPATALPHHTVTPSRIGKGPGVRSPRDSESNTTSHSHPFPLQGKGPGDEGRPTAPPTQPSSAPLHPELIAYLQVTHLYFTASMITDVMCRQAESRTWYDLAEGLAPKDVGHILNQLGLIQSATHHGRFYTITLPDLARLIDAYRLNLPPILATYPRFKEETLRAEIPAGSPGAPLRPPSPALAQALGPDLLAQLRAQLDP